MKDDTAYTDETIRITPVIKPRFNLIELLENLILTYMHIFLSFLMFVFFTIMILITYAIGLRAIGEVLERFRDELLNGTLFILLIILAGFIGYILKSVLDRNHETW